MYCFGLPPTGNPSGTSALLLEETDDAEVAKGKRYRALGHIADCTRGPRGRFSDLALDLENQSTTVSEFTSFEEDPSLME